MTREAALAWLAPRLAEAPPELARAVERCVEAATAAPSRTDSGAGREAVSEARREAVSEARREAASEAGREAASQPDGGPGPAVDLPSFLASAAAEELERAVAGPDDREAALRLLAADAVLTYAFEAAALEGGDVEALAARWGVAGRLGRRAAEAGAARGGRRSDGA